MTDKTNNTTDSMSDSNGDAVSQQYPVGDWMEVGEWDMALKYLDQVRPIHPFGLMYGQQTKEQPRDYEKETDEIRAMNAEQLKAYIDKITEDKISRRDSLLANIDKFMANFPLDLYAATHRMVTPKR